MSHMHHTINTYQGETPLIVASARGDLFDMKLLIAAGCDINKTSQGDRSDGNTALLVASSVGFLDCVKYLIHEKADMAMVDKVGL
jgi:ankyrin repeat protein